MFQVQDVVQQSPSGQLVSGASVKVTNTTGNPPVSTGVPATIYSDNGVTVISNSTVITNGQGEYSYWAPPGTILSEQAYVNNVAQGPPIIRTIPVTADAPASSLPATAVSFTQSGTGAAGTVAAKLQQWTNFKDAPNSAVGDGVTADTAAVNNALSSGKAGFQNDQTSTFNVGALTIPTTVKEILDTTLSQNATGSNVLQATNSNLLRLERADITGIPSTGFASSNDGLKTTTCNNVTVADSHFKTLQGDAMRAEGGGNYLAVNNFIDAVSHGTVFRGQNGVRILGNYAANPQTAPGTFTICWFLDSQSGHAFGNNSNAALVGNINLNWNNAQNFEFHNCQNGVMVGNVADNALMGFSANPFVDADAVKNIAMVGNAARGPTTGLAGVGNSGITFGGTPNSPVTGITASCNAVERTNYVGLARNYGGINVGYASDVALIGDIVRDAKAAGICIFNRATGLAIEGCVIDGITTVGADNNAFLFTDSGNVARVNGVIQGNVIRNATVGFRIDFAVAATVSLTSVGTTVTAIATAHKLTTGDFARITGAAQPQYNGAWIVTVVDVNTFTYTAFQTPAASPATGTITFQPSLDDLYIRDNLMMNVTTPIQNDSLCVFNGVRYAVDQDQSPYVNDTTTLIVSSSAAMTIKYLRGGKVGQRLTLSFTNANTTVDRTSMALAGSVNFASTANSVLHLICVALSGAVQWVSAAQVTNNG